MADDPQLLVYLVRHGEAKSEDKNPARPLTEDGTDDVKRTAAWAAGAGIRVNEIRHSGKLRAQQTAEIFADHLPNARAPEASNGLGPNDDVEPIAQQLARERHPIMLVGHLPFLERLVSHLVAGDANASAVTFDAGALLTLAQNKNGWSILCLLQPRLLPKS